MTDKPAKSVLLKDVKPLIDQGHLLEARLTRSGLGDQFARTIHGKGKIRCAEVQSEGWVTVEALRQLLNADKLHFRNDRPEAVAAFRRQHRLS